MSQPNQSNPRTATRVLKVVVAMVTMSVLWLLAIAQTYSSFVDASAPLHWQVARAIPRVLVALYYHGSVGPVASRETIRPTLPHDWLLTQAQGYGSKPSMAVSRHLVSRSCECNRQNLGAVKRHTHRSTGSFQVEKTRIGDC